MITILKTTAGLSSSNNLVPNYALPNDKLEYVYFICWKGNCLVYGHKISNTVCFSCMVLCKENFTNIHKLIVTIRKCVTNVREQFANVCNVLFTNLITSVH